MWFDTKGFQSEMEEMSAARREECFGLRASGGLGQLSRFATKPMVGSTLQAWGDWADMYSMQSQGVGVRLRDMVASFPQGFRE